MKRKLIALFAAIVVALACAVSCGKLNVKPVVEEGTNGDHVAVYLFITDEYYSGEEMKLSAYMDAVKKAGKFEYETTASDYGAYLTSVNGRAADATKSEFWSLYTSNSGYNGEFGENYEYNGTTLYPASLGMDSLPVKTGETIMFILMTY